MGTTLGIPDQISGETRFHAIETKLLSSHSILLQYQVRAKDTRTLDPDSIYTDGGDWTRINLDGWVWMFLILPLPPLRPRCAQTDAISSLPCLFEALNLLRQRYVAIQRAKSLDCSSV